jgi:hypothetical protein
LITLADDLVAFLRARLDEDEQGARAVTANGWANIGPHPADSRPVAQHIFRHDPARVLREVEAKRRIIDGLEAARDNLQKSAANYQAWAAGEREPHPGVNGSGAESLIPGLTYAMQVLASPYSDHPDYHEEWRP